MLPLFDPRPIRSTPVEPSPAEPVRNAYTLPPDVRRLIGTKLGPFSRIRDGEQVGEYHIVELHDGTLVEQDTDGARRPCRVARQFIESSLRDGFWREVE